MKTLKHVHQKDVQQLKKLIEAYPEGAASEKISTEGEENEVSKKEPWILHSAVKDTTGHYPKGTTKLKSLVE